jgi:hypothetical protein
MGHNDLGRLVIQDLVMRGPVNVGILWFSDVRQHTLQRMMMTLVPK